MTDARQWVQPLFMVHDGATDEKIPLTQERLEQLLAIESGYVWLIDSIRSQHAGLIKSIGGMPKPWPGASGGPLRPGALDR